MRLDICILCVIGLPLFFGGCAQTASQHRPTFDTVTEALSTVGLSFAPAFLNAVSPYSENGYEITPREEDALYNALNVGLDSWLALRQAQRDSLKTVDDLAVQGTH